MEADASGRTDVTAAQGGADTTAPGDERRSQKTNTNRLLGGFFSNRVTARTISKTNLSV